TPTGRECRRANFVQTRAIASERDVLLLHRLGRPARRAGGDGPHGGRAVHGSAGRASAFALPAAGLAVHELEALDDDAELGLLLVGFLVFPGVELETPFDEDGAAFAEVLAHHLAGPTPGFAVNERDLLVLLALG